MNSVIGMISSSGCLASDDVEGEYLTPPQVMAMK